MHALLHIHGYQLHHIHGCEGVMVIDIAMHVMLLHATLLSLQWCRLQQIKLNQTKGQRGAKPGVIGANFTELKSNQINTM